MSAWRAAATACSMPPRSGSSTPEPCGDDERAGLRDRGANAGREIDRLGVVAIDAPTARRGRAGRCANGPISAILLPERGSGSRSPSFLSMTIDLRPASRASARVCGSIERAALALLVDAAEGIVEQAEHRLQRQHAADRLVELRLRHRAAAHEVGQILAVEAALHAHVDAGEEGEPRRVAPVLRVAGGDHLLVAGVVGDDEALETPLAAQQVGHQPMVAGRGHAIDLVERGHGRQRAGVERRPCRSADRPRAAARSDMSTTL